MKVGIDSYCYHRYFGEVYPFQARSESTMSLEGFLGGLEIEGPVNGDVFEVFVEQVLVPQLRPGKVVIWDNVSFHRRESLQDLIEAHGATVKFLPAYSPEFNPIEECWSKLKAWLRKQAARTIETLQKAITEAIQQVTLKDIAGWFRHAGYQFNSNE